MHLSSIPIRPTIHAPHSVCRRLRANVSYMHTHSFHHYVKHRTRALQIFFVYKANTNPQLNFAFL